MVDLRIDAISNRMVESDTAMANFQEFNAPAQGDCAFKAGPARPWRLVLDCLPRVGRGLVFRRLSGWELSPHEHLPRAGPSWCTDGFGSRGPLLVREGFVECDFRHQLRRRDQDSFRSRK